MQTKNISVVGLGKLGATMVGCFASAGFDVVGVDVQETVVDLVRGGRAPVPEPDLQALYSEHAARITATCDFDEAIPGTDATFIIVPTPSTETGEFDTRYAVAAAEAVGRALREKTAYHLVVLTSTVLPGATERDIKPAVERASGRRFGVELGLCYSPEFIAIGNVVEGLMNPDFFLIGEFDKRAGDCLEAIYRRENNATQVRRMSMANAELTKISVNAYVTTKISFANTLAQICDKFPGGNARVVAEAIGTDSRIGSKYLVPGPAFGGPCFPRDNRAFCWFARSVGSEAPISEATDSVNRSALAYLAQQVADATAPGGLVAILGLSYKPRTGVVEESQGVHVANVLGTEGFRVRAFDPWVDAESVRRVAPDVELSDSIEDCLRDADTVVLATAHDEFRDVGPGRIAELAPRATLVDFWHVWEETQRPSCQRVVAPGSGAGEQKR